MNIEDLNEGTEIPQQEDESDMDNEEYLEHHQELFLLLAKSPNIGSPFPNSDTKCVVSRHLFEEEHVILEDLHLDCVVLKVVTIVMFRSAGQQMKALELNPLVVGSPSHERHYYNKATNKN
uniref:Predicted protein n=1 Tax=Physcomitrium patens TaxID=3218 RepID=A9TMF6_PHYPA